MERLKSILIATLLLVAFPALADVTVTGEAVYYGTADDSPADCRRKALEMAKIDALARTFGTIVSQDISQEEIRKNGKETSNFLATSATTVRGEWVADIGEPEFERTFGKDDNIIVRCKVKGKAKPLSNAAPDFNISVLSAPDKRFETTSFKDGDSVYMYFESPGTDGYLTICFEDESGTVVRMFPYVNSDTGSSKMKRGYDYILFDRNRDGNEYGEIDGFFVEAPNGNEFCKLHVLFSPKYYDKGPWHYNGRDSDGNKIPDTMTKEEFDSWVMKLSRNDETLGRKQMNISITAPEVRRENITYQ